jgi:adhesin transport system membrane fusion protein
MWRLPLPDIVRQESLLYSTSLGEMNSNASVAGEQAAQRRQELVEAEARLAQLTSACELADNELNATKKLLATGAASEIEVIRLQKESARARGDRDQARAQVASARASIQEALGSGRDVRLRYINSWRNELSATMQELGSLTQGNKAIADQVSQAAVRSPITGTVKRLAVNTIGAVVMPGGAIAEIVPDKDELIVEAQTFAQGQGVCETGVRKSSSSFPLTSMRSTAASTAKCWR